MEDIRIVGFFFMIIKSIVKNFETKTTVEGLSDSGISTIQWSISRSALLIGYSNGNLDLLTDNKILNLPFIKDKASIPKKSINSIYCDGDFAWLSCDFGIVKVNLKKWEVAETWMIGPLATSIAVLDFTADDRFFWAATGTGIFRADKSNPNLQDYRNWMLQEQLPMQHALAVRPARSAQWQPEELLLMVTFGATEQLLHPLQV